MVLSIEQHPSDLWILTSVCRQDSHTSNNNVCKHHEWTVHDLAYMLLYSESEYVSHRQTGTREISTCTHGCMRYEGAQGNKSVQRSYPIHAQYGTPKRLACASPASMQRLQSGCLQVRCMWIPWLGTCKEHTLSYPAPEPPR